MTALFIIAATIIIIIVFFRSDKKKTKHANMENGGLKVRFPNFVEFCEKYSTTLYQGIKFVKDDGRYIEYKYPLPVKNDRVGYFYLGLQSSFGTYLYTYAISPNGRKISGFMREIHNGRNNGKAQDQSVYTYEIIFDELLHKMEHKENFAVKFVDE